MNNTEQTRNKTQNRHGTRAWVFILLVTLHFTLYTLHCLYAAVLDNMNVSTGWSTGKADASEVSIASVSGYANNAVKMTYDLKSGTWVQMGKDFHSMNLSAGDSISFWYKGTGDSNSIEVKVIDADGDIFVTALSRVTNTSDWTRAIVPFSGMSMWRDSDGQPYGSGSLDTANIKKIGIGITKITGSDAGTLIIDKIQSYVNSSATNKSIDQCGETGANNALGKAIVTGISGNATFSYSWETASPSPFGGSYYSMVYNIPDGYAYFEENLLDVNGSSINATGYGYLTFYLKGAAGGEKPIIELWDNIVDPDALDSINAWETAYGGKAVTTEWQLYSIPLDKFDAAGLDKSSLSAVKFVFKEGASTIYLDQLRFSSSAAPDSTVGPVSTIDDMEEVPTSLGAWSSAADQDAVLSRGTVSGYDGNATQFTYKFNNGWWMITERGLGYNVISDKGFKFKYKGTGGSNNIEFKVTDVDNVVYYKKFYNATNTNDLWRTVSFPFTDMTFFSAGLNSDSSFDFKNIKSIHFAVVTNAGGSGTFTVDDLETISEADFHLTEGFEGIISAFSVQDNPFSPNNDGVKDYGIFDYTLATSAGVTLVIYDTAGNPVMKINEGERSAGSHTITWNGYDSDGRLLRNGLYFYNFKAEDSNNQQDSVKHIIAIIR